MCNFSIPFPSEPDIILAKAKDAVERQKGSFIGDKNSGSFDVSVMGSTIRGSYIVSGQNLELTITDKPFLIPCNTIESFLRAQLA